MPSSSHYLTAGCGCSDRGVVARDAAVHAGWHALVVEQGGPSRGPVDLDALRAARRLRFVPPPSETVVDERARASGRRASGELREACR